MRVGLMAGRVGVVLWLLLLVISLPTLSVVFAVLDLKKGTWLMKGLGGATINTPFSLLASSNKNIPSLSTNTPNIIPSPKGEYKTKH